MLDFQGFGGGAIPRTWRWDISSKHKANKKHKSRRKAQRLARRKNR